MERGEAMEAFLATDWLRGCRTDQFCFQCTAPMCAHCCAVDHRALHHAAGPMPVQIATVRGVPAMKWEEARGCGYFTDDIQRFRQGDHLWIPLLPPQQQDRRMKKDHCLNCDLAVQSSKDFCSVSCRTEILNSKGTDMAVTLVEFAENYNQPSIRLNTFCTICLRAFNAECCPNHTVHHNGPNAAAAGALLRVENMFGWPVVEGDQLPAAFAQNVQAILHQETGRLWYPIHRRHNVEDIEHQVDEQNHACLGVNCPEVIPGDFGFCSLRCRHIG